MIFNVDKWTVFHLGTNNLEYDYKIRENVISSSTTEKDISVVISKFGNSTEQCIFAARKANVIFGMIKKILISIVER